MPIREDRNGPSYQHNKNAVSTLVSTVDWGLLAHQKDTLLRWNTGSYCDPRIIHVDLSAVLEFVTAVQQAAAEMGIKSIKRDGDMINAAEDFLRDLDGDI